MLVVCLCKPAIYKLKILGGGNFNIINQSEEPQKRGNQIFKVHWEGAKGGTRFLTYIYWGKPWRKLWGIIKKPLKS